MPMLWFFFLFIRSFLSLSIFILHSSIVGVHAYVSMMIDWGQSYAFDYCWLIGQFSILPKTTFSSSFFFLFVLSAPQLCSHPSHLFVIIQTSLLEIIINENGLCEMEWNNGIWLKGDVLNCSFQLESPDCVADENERMPRGNQHCLLLRFDSMCVCVMETR